MQQEIRPVFHLQGVHSVSRENKRVNGQAAQTEHRRHLERAQVRRNVGKET